MKICVIGDVHGSNVWKEIIDKEKERVDKFIFLGDYVDDREGLTTPAMQLENLQEIIEDYKPLYDIDLLVGNHDMQYIGLARCDKHSQAIATMVNDYLLEMIRKQMLKVVVHYDNYLFSHAGVSSEWLKRKRIKNLADINREFVSSPFLIDFVSEFDSDQSGDNIYQSPIWIRPDSLFQSAINGYHQVVGHTRLEEIGIIAQNNYRLIFTDTGLKQYLVIDTNMEMEQIINL